MWHRRPRLERLESRIPVTPSGELKRTRMLCRVLGIFLIASAFVFGLMRWGGFLLTSDDPLPPHADVAVVLQGSVLAEQARLSGAVELLQEGTVLQILVSIPKQSYWGQSLEPIAVTYIARTYGQTSAARTRFCETGPEINSTEQESAVLAKCIKEYDWHSIVLVTSDYHTRRALIIWKRVLKGQNSSIEHLWVHSVGSAEFHAVGWWRERTSAKTWIIECTKLLWTLAAS